jgi:oligoendopeptidase F
MMEVVESNLEVGREALRLKAKDLALDALAPWDLFAPAPSSHDEGIPFAEAISLIRTAFGDVDPSMAEFVDTMATQGWIEGSVNDTKRPGAYCTRFAKSRTPRVYMTYRGSLEDIGTLAHELGHGFHSWVMRDLPLPETAYPMTLAETASIFAETVTSEVLLVQASKDPTQAAIKRQILWGELGSAEAFLLNIPARFWFESELYTRRQERPLSPDEISELMTQAWRKAYGSTLSEMNPLFWCSKLHFHMSSTSFYNFPYTFGYLFALGVYAQRPKHGAAFLKNYVGLLRDTGRMTVEDLARKHLGVDVQKPEFWQDSINLVRSKISLYGS